MVMHQWKNHSDFCSGSNYSCHFISNFYYGRTYGPKNSSPSYSERDFFKCRTWRTASVGSNATLVNPACTPGRAPRWHYKWTDLTSLTKKIFYVTPLLLTLAYPPKCHRIWDFEISKFLCRNHIYREQTQDKMLITALLGIFSSSHTVLATPLKCVPASTQVYRNILRNLKKQL